jgi:hypothetical protein
MEKRLAASVVITNALGRKEFSIGTLRLQGGKLDCREKTRAKADRARDALWQYVIDNELAAKTPLCKTPIAGIVSERGTARLLRAAGVYEELDGLRIDIAEEDARLRLAAVGVLSGICSSNDLERLAALLKTEKDFKVQRACADAMMKIGKDTAAEDLAVLAVTGPEELLRALMPSLRRAGGVVLGYIKGFAHDRDYHVRDRLCAVLGALGSMEAVPLLTDLLYDPEPPVRASAIKALKALTGEDFGYKLDTPRPQVEIIAKRFKELYREWKEKREE